MLHFLICWGFIFFLSIHVFLSLPYAELTGCLTSSWVSVLIDPYVGEPGHLVIRCLKLRTRAEVGAVCVHACACISDSSSGGGGGGVAAVIELSPPQSSWEALFIFPSTVSRSGQMEFMLLDKQKTRWNLLWRFSPRLNSKNWLCVVWTEEKKMMRNGNYNGDFFVFLFFFCHWNLSQMCLSEAE